MILREAAAVLAALATQYKAVGVTGPRQSGKTTLVRTVFKHKPYVSLENPDTRAFALNDPRGFLSQYPNGAILDEVQRSPELFSYLQQILDESKAYGQFILTGSNNFLLQQNISQSLAGRIGYINLLPFSLIELKELPAQKLNDYLFNGMYPPLYDSTATAASWYANYIRTYIERDVRQLKNITNLLVFERFVKLCAGRTGQLLNMNSLALETGIDNKTAASWISILESSFIVFRLQPHHINYNKRVVKMPKLYFYDTGLVCALLGIQDAEALTTFNLRGNLFENFVITELLKARFNKGLTNNLFFWRDNTGHEVDVLLEQNNNLYPVEIKSGQTITADYFKAIDYWNKISGNTNGTVVYGGNEHQKRSNNIEVLPWNRIEELG